MKVESESQLVEAVRGARAPLRIVGGGTRPVGALAGEPLQVAISGISLYEPGALTLIAGAGTPLAEIEAAVAAEGQRLPVEPARWGALLGASGESTIGGVVAANVSGPRRVQAGACRDSLIGVRFVDGTGAAVKNGGRVMKNVTGYDLVKLMAGSRGTLGALTEISFRTAPIPPVTATLALPDLDAAAAIPVLSSALGGPFDVSGAAWLPGHGALIRVEGLAASVKARAADLTARLSAFGTVQEGDPEAWDLLCRTSHHPDLDTWRITCRPSEAPALLARLPEPRSLDWGGALIHVRLPRGQMPDLPTFSGHARRISGAPGILPAPDPLTDRLERDLRARFDPRGLFGNLA